MTKCTGLNLWLFFFSPMRDVHSGRKGAGCLGHPSYLQLVPGRHCDFYFNAMYFVSFFCCFCFVSFFLFMFCLHLWKYSMYVCNSHRCQRGALDILKLELLTKQSCRSWELNPTSKYWLFKTGFLYVVLLNLKLMILLPPTPPPEWRDYRDIPLGWGFCIYFCGVIVLNSLPMNSSEKSTHDIGNPESNCKHLEATELLTTEAKFILETLEPSTFTQTPCGFTN